MNTSIQSITAGASLFRRITGSLLALFAFLFSARFAAAEVSIYAKFQDGTGIWAGELEAPRQGWTQLDSAALSFTNPAVIGSTTNTVTFNPVTIRKAVNKLTPQIFSSIVTGAALRNLSLPADLTLEFVTTGAAGPVVFFRIELRYLIFSSQQTLAANGDTDAQEEVQIQFGAARLTSWPISPAGVQGAPKIDTWNRIRGNTNFNDVP